MTTSSTALALWDNGRLVARRPERRFPFEREQVLIAALGVLALVVFAIFVAVLENDVHRADVAKAELRSRVLAEADCESTRPAATRGGCIALFDGVAPAQAVVAADVPPANTAWAGDGNLAVAAMGGSQ